MKIVVTVGVMIVLALFLQEAIRIGYLYKKARDLDQTTRAFSATSDSSYTILFVGDRSFFASGLEDPLDSLPGQVAGFLGPGKIAVDGSPALQIKDLYSVLVRHAQDTPDLVIISVGENDILHKNVAADIKGDLEKAIEIAGQISDKKVILIAPRDISLASIMPPILPSQYKKLTESYESLYSEVAAESGTEFLQSSYVGDAWGDVKKDEMYLSDEFHLSTYGYKIWSQGIIDNSILLKNYQKQ